MPMSVTEVERRPMCPAITIYFKVRTIHNGSELWDGPEAQSAVFSTSDSLFGDRHRLLSSKQQQP